MKQKRTRKQKGEFGYLKEKRKRSCIQTLLLFALSLSVYGIGYYSTGSNKNVLSIVAVLGMLPASKSAVSTILYLKSKDCSQSIYEQILPHAKGLSVLYELILTSYDKNFPISSIAVTNDHVIGYSENPKCDVNAAGKHIETMLKQNAFTKVSVKIFSELEKYNNRLDQLNELSAQTEKQEEEREQITRKEQEMLAVICEISL